MMQFNVTGMSCAACSARVEKAVSALNGVQTCSVNLLTNSMNVEGTATEDEIISAVVSAGYGASLKVSEALKTNNKQSNDLQNNETKLLRNRLLWSLGFLVILMYFSMGHSMLGLPLPPFFHGNGIALGLTQLILSAIVMVINQKFFVNGFKGVLHRSPNMDTLVSMGSGAAFIYSTYVLFTMTVSNNDLSRGLYFESAAMILTLITLGKLLESISKGRTTDALKGLMELAPKTANVIRNGNEITVKIEDVRVGDLFVVRPGESIPVDGVVVEGTSAVNESALTGESVPIDKTIGDNVTSATTNLSGFLKCKALRVGEDTTLSQIIKMVSDASSTKAPIAKIADKVSGIFVPVVIIIAVITTVIWLLLDQTVGFAIARGISVLVISCPCALGLATPVAIMVGNGVGAKNGILFKTAESLETAGRTKTVVLDKTGTITNGEPIVTDVLAVNCTESELLSLAYSLEALSEHPLAKAIVKYAEEQNLTTNKVENFEILPGNGLVATLNGAKLCGGSMKFAESKVLISDEVKAKANTLSNDGKTPLFFIKDNVFLGIIAVADTLKSDSAQAIQELKNLSLKVIMLTGDNERTANAIGKLAGVDSVISDVLPDGKEKKIAELCKNDKVAMVGDGINDAPALARADVGIAIGAGSDIAIDAADVVLVKSSLLDVAKAIRLSRATLRTIKQNLFWAFIYNIIGIPLAAGVFISLLGWEMNPMFGAAAMSISSFCVVTNALRLNFAKLSNKTNTIKKKEQKEMIKTFNVDGMMCGHCEAHVKKALEAIEGVTLAEPNKDTKSVTVHLSTDVNDEIIIKAITDEGYKVF